MDEPGSSPLTRGLQLQPRTPAPIRRLIPADAGLTDTVLMTVLMTGAHPR